MLTKSYKDYLTEAEQSLAQPGDYLHVVTEDGITHIQLDEVGGVVNLLRKIPGAGKIIDKLTKGKGKIGKMDKVKKGGAAGAGYAAGTGGGLLGSLLFGPNKGNYNLFKAGYDISSNQFVGKNPVVETLNTEVTQKFSQNISHFVLDLR